MCACLQHPLEHPLGCRVPARELDRHLRRPFLDRIDLANVILRILGLLGQLLKELFGNELLGVTLLTMHLVCLFSI